MRLRVCGGEEVTFSILDANFKLRALESLEEKSFWPCAQEKIFSLKLLNSSERENPLSSFEKMIANIPLKPFETLDTLEDLETHENP